MKKVTLSVSLTGEERKKMAMRCHFGAAELSRIEALYEAAFPLVQAQACVKVPAPGQVGEGGALHALCVVTLGGKLDTLQELYGSVQAVSEDYILECIGNALLEKAYQELGRLLWQETGLYLNRYQFPGTHMPIEKIKEILQEMSEGDARFPVTCNECYTLRPKKSVVFVGVLGENKEECGICDSCPKRDCENRQPHRPGQVGEGGSGGGQKRKKEHGQPGRAGAPGGRPENYSYGYQKIFGRVQGAGGEKGDKK